MIFSLTKSCQSRCKNCLIWATKPANELRLDEIETIAANSKFLSWLNITGGEPTDRNDLFDVIAAFYKGNPNLYLVNFSTNGLRPEAIEEACQKIASLQIPKFLVSISLDGPKALHDEIRGIPGNFELAIESYQRLKKIPGVEALFGMTLFANNAAYLEDCIRSVKEHIPDFSLRNFHLNIGHFSQHFYLNSKTPMKVPKDLTQTISRFWELRGRPRSLIDQIEFRYQRNIPEYLSTGFSPVACEALNASCFLSEKGEIHPCTIWDRPLGNIRDHNLSLLPILKDTRTLQTRQEIIDQKCPQCWSPCEATQSLLGNIF